MSLSTEQQEILRLGAENLALKRALARDRHDEPCYYCQEKTNNLAANPGLWAIPLCHEDEPGVVKWHHIDCVSERLRQLDELLLETHRNEPPND